MAPPLATNTENVEQHRKSVLESRIEPLANVKNRLKQPVRATCGAVANKILGNEHETQKPKPVQ